MRLELHYLIHKSEQQDARWIILVNGLFADLESYNEIIYFFKDKFHILRYDCRGQGKSPKPLGVYSLASHVSDLKNLVTKLEIDQFYILGLSNGGRIALSYALENSREVLAVVACDTYAKVSKLITFKLQSWLSAYEKGGALHRFDITGPWIFGESIIRDNPELIELYRSRAKNMEEQVFNSLVLGAMGEDILIEQIKCPILFIVGDEDVLTPLYLHKEMLESCLKNSVYAQLFTVKGGHASILEYPEAVPEKILPFLRSL